MYRVQIVEKSCRVVDDEDRVVFVGSLRECEEWLDATENQATAEERSVPDSAVSDQAPDDPTLLDKMKDSLFGRPASGESPG